MFDPNKQYQWKLDDKIEFTGKEFHIIQQAMQQFITSNMDVSTILRLAQVYAITVAKMNEYIENGTITENSPDQPDQQSA